MTNGTVTMVARRSAAFGFIRPDGRKEDVFFNSDAVVTDADLDEIEQYSRVQFDTAPDQKKPGKTTAVNVRLINFKNGN